MGKVAGIAVLLIFMTGQIALAHPPQKIEVNYSPSEKTVKGVIYHNVGDPKKHYIKGITVRQGKEVLAEKTFSEQENKKTENVNIAVPNAKAGEPVTITAKCNIAGTGTAVAQVK